MANNWDMLRSHKEFIQKVVSGHDKIEDYTVEKELLYEIDLGLGLSYKVLFVNKYIMTLADIFAAKKEFGTFDFIVTCANWNSYTREAKEYGWENNLGVFNIGEFSGALNLDDPIKYFKKGFNGQPEYAIREEE